MAAHGAEGSDGAGVDTDLEGYEVAFKQPWVWWMWTPLRFPGQYYDAETELHENWNRNYDPGRGIYLQPEPFLLDQKFSFASAKAGRSAPVYSYALNNPINFYDPNGLDVPTDMNWLRKYLNDLCRKHSKHPEFKFKTNDTAKNENSNTKKKEVGSWQCGDASGGLGVNYGDLSAAWDADEECGTEKTDADGVKSRAMPTTK